METLTAPDTVEAVTTAPAPTPKLPSVETFKEVVRRHCHNQGTVNVSDLCTAQTQALIDELAPLFR
jgi:hypothetical protein